MEDMETMIKVDRYSEQLDKWRRKFQTEGKSIIAKHGKYPMLKERYVRLHFFEQVYLVDLESGEILGEEKESCRLTDMEQMMIYSHLQFLKKDAAASGNPVSYEEIRGNSHVSGWAGRIGDGLKELCGYLDMNRNAVEEAVRGTAGVLWDKGDLSFVLTPFDDVKFYYVYWQGDEEFPSDLRILYDENILEFMHQESVIIIGDIGAERIIKQLKNRERRF